VGVGAEVVNVPVGAGFCVLLVVFEARWQPSGAGSAAHVEVAAREKVEASQASDGELVQGGGKV
jgi:hypothetical protein